MLPIFRESILLSTDLFICKLCVVHGYAVYQFRVDSVFHLLSNNRSYQIRLKCVEIFEYKLIRE